MIWKCFKITDDFNVSVVCRNKKVSVCLWSARKGGGYQNIETSVHEIVDKS